MSRATDIPLSTFLFAFFFSDFDADLDRDNLRRGNTTLPRGIYTPDRPRARERGIPRRRFILLCEERAGKKPEMGGFVELDSAVLAPNGGAVYRKLNYGGSRCAREYTFATE